MSELGGHPGLREGLCRAELGLISDMKSLPSASLGKNV